MREKAASPTVISESVFITSTIDAKENRDVMTCDIPNTFVQIEIKKQEIGERIIMKIRGTLLEILVEIDPEKYDELHEVLNSFLIEAFTKKTLDLIFLN